MSDTSSDNKRIAKNTLLLYGRMLYSLFISLFTARVILNALGFEDYGLYNVIGSVVSMFVFLRSAMGNSVNRYITYAIGKGDQENLNKIFSMSLMIFFGLAIVIVLLCETIGLWFLNTQMEIPVGREVAANWVFQFSILSCALSVICVPYDAEIIAHEKMGVFAIIQVLNSTLNLAIVYAVKYFPQDKLIFYAFLLFLIQVMNRIIYGIYCSKHFSETKFHRVKDKALLKEMTGFAGWSLFGNLAYVAYSQGQNIILNMFFGPVVNAARGIAFNVQGAIKGFVTNFQMALNPQITKSYAREDYDRLHNLIFASSKLSFCLLWCLVLPVFIEAETLLQLWLKDVPDHTVMFLRLVVLIMMWETLENPIMVANAATGKIRTYQIVVGGILLAILPISYFALKLKSIPELVFIVQFIMAVVAQIARLIMTRDRLQLSLRQYLYKILVPCFLVVIISSLCAYPLSTKIPNTIVGFLGSCAVSVVIAMTISFVVALNKRERLFLISRLPILKRFAKNG